MRWALVRPAGAQVAREPSSAYGAAVATCFNNSCLARMHVALPAALTLLFSVVVIVVEVLNRANRTISTALHFEVFSQHIISVRDALS